MAQQVETRESKPDDLCLIPGTHMLEETTDFHKMCLARTTDTQSQIHS